MIVSRHFMIRLGTDIFHAVLLSLQSKDLIENIFFSEIDTQQIHVLIRHVYFIRQLCSVLYVINV